MTQYVQHVVSTPGVTPNSVTITGVVAGNSLIAFPWTGNNIAPSTPLVSDAQGTYAAAGTAVTDSTNAIWANVYVLQNANAGSHTLTWSTQPAGVDTLQLFVVEAVAPTLWTPASLGALQVNPGTGVGALSSGVLSGAGLLIAMSVDDNVVNSADCPAAIAGYTRQNNNSNGTIGSWSLLTKEGASAEAALATAIVGADRFITIGIIVPALGGAALQLMAQAAL